ncbi:DUF6809 family protein [Paenibacillus sp. 2TAF8]|uniref:DUF6809 family protein n=1 Tax=Paenibacillus sp. 2TAF8 TaxID=3233020 RepID=UPI003F9AC550
MKSILEAIYYGNLRPEESMVSNDPEFQSISRDVSACVEDFQNYFSEEDFKKLESLLDKMYQIQSINSCDAFVEGFRVGVLIMNEAFKQK